MTAVLLTILLIPLQFQRADPQVRPTPEQGRTALTAPVVTPHALTLPDDPPRRDTILMRNGEIVEGEILELRDGLLHVRVPAMGGRQFRKFPIQQVEGFALEGADDALPFGGEINPFATPAPPQGVGWEQSQEQALPTLDPAAKAARLNAATQALQPSQRRAVRYFNEHRRLKRASLEALAAAHRLRTQAASFGTSARDRQQLMQQADRLQEESTKLAREADEYQERYERALERR